MADNNLNQNRPDSTDKSGSNERLRSEANKGDTPNQTMQHEQAKSSVGGDRRDDKSGFGKDRQEKSAIGGGDSGSQTGEPGRARSELDQDKNRGERDKKPSETTGQR